MMTQFVYWYAPLWQVVMVVATGILLVFVLLWLVRQQPDVSAALISVDPALGQQPVLYFDRAHGVVALNDGGETLLKELQDQGQSKMHALADVLLEAQAETRVIQEDTILSGQTLVVIPIFKQPDVVSGVLAMLAPQIALPQPLKPEPAKITPSALNIKDWQVLDNSLMLHSKRALIQVKRSVAVNCAETASVWQEHQLSATENQLLRYLLDHTDIPQSSDALFRMLWPQDEVDQFGLRPDQGDRLRRVVFTLRQKIEPNARTPRYLCTVHGGGYVVHAKIQGDDL